MDDYDNYRNAVRKLLGFDPEQELPKLPKETDETKTDEEQKES